MKKERKIIIWLDIDYENWLRALMVDLKEAGIKVIGFKKQKKH